MAARPVHERLHVPIPAFADLTFTGGSGFDLNKVHPHLIRDFARARRCYVCAEPMSTDADVYFLGDEQSFLQSYYPETLGHEACLLAALNMCPWITRSRFARATERRLGQPRLVEDERKPIVWVLASSREYDYGSPSGRRGLYPRELRNPRYFGYVEEQLMELSLDQMNDALAAAGEETLPS